LRSIVAGTHFGVAPIVAVHNSGEGLPRDDPCVLGAAAPRDLGRLAVPVVAVVVGVASASVAWRGTANVTTYAGASTPALAADLAAGFGLLAVGAINLMARPSSLTGPLTTLIGVTWLAHDWVGWEGAPAFARSVAMVTVPFIVPLLVHVSLVQPSGHLRGRWTRGFVVAAYGVTGVIAGGTALVRDPFLDQHCWSNCHDNTFLLRADQHMARALGAIGLRSTIVFATITAVVCVVRLATATRVARRMMSYVVVPASAALLATVAYAVVLIAEPDEDPETSPYTTVFFLRASTLIALALGVGIIALHAWRTGRSVALLAEAIGAAPPPGSLGPALSRSLGDDGLEVAYWLPSSQRYVDASGRTVDPAPAPGQAVTAIVRDNRPVAVVVHDASLDAERELGREIGAAARLAVDNERLRAEVLAQVDDLRASRSRIVETADATRRRLERDVHDIAQQRLLAASFELRLAHAEAEESGDVALAARLSTASDDTQRALVELRELAHGIFPAILTEAGLEPALRTLAARSSVPVEIVEVVEERFPMIAETAAYYVVTAGIELAAARSATVTSLSIRNDDDRLVVELHDDGTGPAADATHIADRVGALGGALAVAPGSLRAKIPCAS
jgi:signal transduction histidine kinase